MTDPRHELGMTAEAAVAAWLERAGWTILARRHRSNRGGEVDLLGLDPGGILVAIEVRARRDARTGGPASSVGGRRVRRLERTLADYAVATDVPHRGLRVDLVGVEPVRGRVSGGRSWRLWRIPDIGSR